METISIMGLNLQARFYGGIYNWHAVVDKRRLAPEGWHIPSKEEFVVLLGSIGANTEDFASGDVPGWGCGWILTVPEACGNTAQNRR